MSDDKFNARATVIQHGLPSTRCSYCGEKFVMGRNVCSEAGRRETWISGVCETCFDDLFSDDENPGQAIQ